MRLSRLIAAGLAVVAALCGAPVLAADCLATEAQIDWAVEGRFRLFLDGEAQARGDQLIASIERAGSLEAAYVDVIKQLTQADGTPLFRLTHYDRRRERYGLGEGVSFEADRRKFLTPGHHVIRAGLPGAQEDNCQWIVDGVQQSETACANVKLTITKVWSDPERPTTVTVVNGTRSATTCVVVRDTLILAFGDSFASGEGNPDQPTDWTAINTKKLPTKADLKKKLDWSGWWLWYTKGGTFLPDPFETEGQAAASECDGPSADWWDAACHRSLLSQQALAAMGRAAKNPKETVTFISYACSGAGVLDGLLAPRTSSVGQKRFQDQTTRSTQQSQLNQAVEGLCDQLDGAQPYDYKRISADVVYWNEAGAKTPPQAPGQATNEVAVRRCLTWLRRPDVVMNVIGGNDIGFGGGVAWAIVPPKDRSPIGPDLVVLGQQAVDNLAGNPGLGVVCPTKIPKQRRCYEPFSKKAAPTMEALIATDLPKLYQLADRALGTAGLTGPSPSPVRTEVLKLWSSYPLPTRDGRGEFCGAWTSDPGVKDQEDWAKRFPVSDIKRSVEPWKALSSTLQKDAPILFWSGEWSFGISNMYRFKDCKPGADNRAFAHIDLAEACVLETYVINPMNDQVERMEGHGWKIVRSQDVPTNHGLCAHREDPVGYYREFGWPRWNGEQWLLRNGQSGRRQAAWVPIKDPNAPMSADGHPPLDGPASWRPYEPRSRWFRTANDSALTMFVAGTGTKGAKEALTGTVHPTAQMHAALADQLVDQMK